MSAWMLPVAFFCGVCVSHAILRNEMRRLISREIAEREYRYAAGLLSQLDSRGGVRR